MQDVNSEILKLKALINNKQNTSVFANKANDCNQLVHGKNRVCEKVRKTSLFPIKSAKKLWEILTCLTEMRMIKNL